MPIESQGRPRGHGRPAEADWTMMRRGWSASATGSSAVEFAIILPLILLLTFGMIEAARGWNSMSALNHIVREGARLGAVTPADEWDSTGNPAVQEAQDRAVGTLVDTSQLAVCAGLTYEDASGSPATEGDASCSPPSGTNHDEWVYVRASHPITLNFIFWQSSFTLSADAVARYER